MDAVYSSLLRSELEKNPAYQQALHLVRHNAQGPIWLTGGLVYRTLCGLMFAKPTRGEDIDFLVGELSPQPDLPAGWTQGVNRLGVRWTGPLSERIDPVQLDCVHSITRRGLTPSVENYLSGVPLNVQAIAYDVTEGRIVGETGMDAILSATVTLNNVEEAEFMAELKKTMVAGMITAKAKELGFYPDVPAAYLRTVTADS